VSSLDPTRRTRVVVQARLSSSRLPGKAMLEIAGFALVELVARRAARAGHELVVATGDEDDDEVIAHRLDAVGIPVVRGALDDVLGRFAAACEDLDDEDLVVRLTGDNPIVDGDLVTELVQSTADSGHRYGRVDIEAAPEGLGVEVFTAGDLRAAAVAATSDYDREHVTAWLRRALGEHLFVPDGSPADIHAYRATVDTLSDYVRVSRLFRGVGDPVRIPWRELMHRLGDVVRSAGSRAPRKDLTLAGPAAIALEGAAIIARDPEVRPHAGESARQRELLAYAVGHGVTDLFIDAGESRVGAAVRGAVVPALVGRLSSSFRVTASGGTPAMEALRARAELERAFALTGQRRARSILARGPMVSADLWSVISGYVAEGVAQSAGCVVSSATELQSAAGLSGMSVIEVGWDDDSWVADSEQTVADVFRTGVDIMVRLPATAGPETLRGLLARPWVSAVIVPVHTAGALAEILAASDGVLSAPPDHDEDVSR